MTERTLAQQVREWHIAKHKQRVADIPRHNSSRSCLICEDGYDENWITEDVADFAQSLIEEEARILIEWFKEWRPCDCGADDGKKYNTECGHAINCDMYAAHELARSMRTRHGL